jgi:hypothetical protein
MEMGVLTALWSFDWKTKMEKKNKCIMRAEHGTSAWLLAFGGRMMNWLWHGTHGIATKIA